jgi:hypothetical protein
MARHRTGPSAGAKRLCDPTPVCEIQQIKASDNKAGRRSFVML